MTTQEHIIELSLLENGLDFIIKGIDELYELHDDIEYQHYIDPVSQPHKDYKYGVIHLFSGFLLLLKERLSHHMPELIFNGTIAEVRKKLDSRKEPNTVNLDRALERLEVGPKVTFSETDIKLIRKVQSYRNKFEHYKISMNKFEINKIIIDFIDLIDRFLVRELKIDITSSSLNINPETRSKVLSIESVYRRMTNKWRHELIKIGETKIEKFNDNRNEILEDLEREAYLAVKDGDIDPTIECSKCEEEILIVTGEYSGVYTNEECNSYSAIKCCDRCGNFTTGYEWEEK